MSVARTDSAFKFLASSWVYAAVKVVYIFDEFAQIQELRRLLRVGLATYILAAQGEGGAADLALSRLTRGLEVLIYFELLPDNNRREHSKSAHQKDQVGEERR